MDDSTASSHGETQQRRRNASLALALDATLTSIWDYDVTANRITLDRNWSRMLGGPSVETVVSIRNMFDLIHSDDRKRALNASFACLTGRTDEYSQEYRIRDGRGDWVWVHSRGRVMGRDSRGHATRMIGTNIDVSQRKTSELAVSRQLEFFQAFNQTTLALLQRRGKSEILEALVGRAAELLGSACTEVALLEGDHLASYAHGGTAPNLCGQSLDRQDAPFIWRAIDTREPVVLDFTTQPASPSDAGKPAFATVAVFPILHGAKCLGILGFARAAPGRIFSPEEQQKGRLLAQLAALVIHNASIYEDALRIAETRASALMEQERVFRNFIENINQGFYTANRRGIFIYCNPAISAVTGWSEEELRGTSSFRLVAPEDRPRVIDLYRRLGGTPQTDLVCEFQVETKQGRRLFVEQTTHILREPDGSVQEYRNFLRDITERKKAEATLRETEAENRRLALIASETTDAIAICDSKRRIEWVNQGFTRLTGYTLEEVLGQVPGRILQGPETDPATIATMRQALGANTPVTVDVLNYHKCGRKYWIRLNIHPLLGPDGAATGFFSSAFDITARREADLALRESETKFKGVFDASPIPIILLTFPEGRIQAMNHASVELFGFNLDEAFNRTTTELNIWPDPSLRRSFMEQLQTRGRLEAIEVELQRKDGRRINILYSASRLTLADQPCMLATMIDVTANKQMESALRKSEAQLRQAQKMESLGTLAGGIAHDFNNILTGILGFTQLSLTDLEPHHPAAQWLDGILKSGERAKGLVQQILKFSHKTESARAPTRLQAVVRESVDLLRSTLPAMVRLECNIDPACPPVLADVTEIHQIVLNLCTNAWHALPEQGGCIEIGLAPCEVTAALAQEHPPLLPGPHVRLTVRDNGKGMSAATLERIFEPFFTTKEAGKGTGLGLAVVHSVVGAHSGAILVHSTPGKGTLFEIYLPAMATAEVRPDTVAPANIPRGHGEAVLVVDDDTISGSVIAGLVNKLGYKATLCAEPFQAIAMLFANDYAVLVTDLAMPGLPGDELARQALARKPKLPVMLLSGFIEPGKLEQLRGIGVREVLNKPPAYADLAGALHRCISG